MRIGPVHFKVARLRMNERVIALLDQLAGHGHGQEILQQLLHSDDPLEQIAQRIANTDAFEYLYKHARTRDVMAEGLKEADAAFVGLPELPAAMPFEEQFWQDSSDRGSANAPTASPRYSMHCSGRAAICSSWRPAVSAFPATGTAMVKARSCLTRWRKIVARSSFRSTSTWRASIRLGARAVQSLSSFTMIWLPPCTRSAELYR